VYSFTSEVDDTSIEQVEPGNRAKYTARSTGTQSGRTLHLKKIAIHGHKPYPWKEGTQEKTGAESRRFLHILTLKLLHVMIEALLDGCRVPQGALQIGYRFRMFHPGLLALIIPHLISRKFCLTNRTAI
jgi:hypothetical protein